MLDNHIVKRFFQNKDILFKKIIKESLDTDDEKEKSLAETFEYFYINIFAPFFKKSLQEFFNDLVLSNNITYFEHPVNNVILLSKDDELSSAYTKETNNRLISSFVL